MCLLWLVGGGAATEHTQPRWRRPRSAGDADGHGQDGDAAGVHHQLPVRQAQDRQTHLLHAHSTGDGQGTSTAVWAMVLAPSRARRVCVSLWPVCTALTCPTRLPRPTVLRGNEARDRIPAAVPQERARGPVPCRVPVCAPQHVHPPARHSGRGRRERGHGVPQDDSASRAPRRAAVLPPAQ